MKTKYSRRSQEIFLLKALMKLEKYYKMCLRGVLLGYFFPLICTMDPWSWKENSVVKSTGGSSRGPGFYSQHLHHS